MAEPGPAVRRDRWFPLLIAAIVALAASFVVLALVLFNVVTDGETRDGGRAEAASPEPSATPSSNPALTYAGELPAAAAGLGLEPAGEGQTPDIEFISGQGDGALVLHYFVPVASLGAGIDALELGDLQRIWSGEIENWSELGGQDLEVRVAGLAENGVAPGDLPRGDGPPQTAFESWDSLRAAMTLDSGIFAVVPIEELSPEMVAIAIGDVDLARGFGDPASWPLAERVRIVAQTARGELEAGQLRELLAAKLPEITRVVATGDVLQSRCSLAAIEATGDWAAALRGPMAEYLAAADLTLSSLDGSIQGIAKPFGCIETTNLTSPPEVIEALTLAGIDGMTVATNHAFDCADAGCGSDAMIESITRLNEAGIKTVGGGNNLEEALAAAIFEVNGVKFGVLGFDDIAAEDLEATEDGPGTAPLDDSYENERLHEPREPAFYKPADLLGVSRLEERIRKLKGEVDVVIVQIQSGTEDTHTPSPRSIKALRAAADAGADLVVGNQAHWVQALELRGGAFVAYALGNFIFDQRWTPEHTQGYLLEATFHGAKLVTTRLIPYQIEERYRPVFVEGETRAKVLGDVFEASLALP